MKLSMYRLCKNISKARQERGMSVEEFAQRMNESVESVMQIEKGRKYLTLQMLMSACWALNMTTNELMVDVETVSRG